MGYDAINAVGKDKGAHIVPTREVFRYGRNDRDAKTNGKRRGF